MTWAKDQYDKWVPWLEDKFLKLFTKDNKASYATKGTNTPFPIRSALPRLDSPIDDTNMRRMPPLTDHLGKTKVTGNKDVDDIQDRLHEGVAGHIGQGGAAQPVGDVVSKEGVNRAERKGRDDKGSYVPNPSNLLGGK